MSDLESRLAKLSPAQRALLEKRARQQAAKQNSEGQASTLPAAIPPGAAEPIAIVGLACRLPGGATLDEYWQTIHNGQLAVTETPADRWDVDSLYDPDGKPGKLNTRWGGFLQDIDQFDPRFFGITPREANRMDPQQRLLLEVTWEALEHGGLLPDTLAGSKTGVYVGIGGNDYSKVPLHRSPDYIATIDGYMGTGNALSIAANRLSYVFDWKGPSLAIDTACSSSSIAVCLAVDALRRGECTAAVAAGVNAILTPETTIAFSNAHMLSPHGRCRPFDAAADGYVRGEGCGVVVLKRLADATRDGDHVLAVVRAAAMNQDGRTSGISAPNGESQKACIRAALHQAKLSPDQINYIEAHGTGTPLGDPIEMRALADLFRESTADEPRLRVTSVKANIGHTETVSGIAGLIKVAMMMRHGVIPPHAGFESLNPHIDLAGTRIEIPTEATPWQGHRLAGVSSFGFGGANAHLIVEGPPAAPPAESSKATPAADVSTEAAPSAFSLLKLSAKSPEALQQQAATLGDWLATDPDAATADFCYTLNTGRSDHAERAAIVATGRNDLQQQLTDLASGTPSPATRRGSASGVSRLKTAMLFSGQGSQYAAMGRELYQTNAIFRREIDRCDQLLGEVLEESLTDVLFGEATASLIDQTVYTQPALFAIEHALAEVWKSLGVEPDFVAGHSIGEYVAASVAGVMSTEDAMRLVAERARLMQQAPMGGKMAAIFAAESVVADVVAAVGDRVAIAAVNAPDSTVVSGEADAVQVVIKVLSNADIEHRELAVSHAFHSPMMDELLDDFEAFAATISYDPPDRPLASNLTGELMTAAPTPRYWRDHLRGAVRFADNLQTLANAGATRLIEVGPGASLLGMARRTLGDASLSASPSLRRGMSDAAVLAGSIAEHYAAGGQIDWRGIHPGGGQRLLLPTYPFERERCWIEGADLASEQAAIRPLPSAGGRLLGTRAPSAWSTAVYESQFSPNWPTYLADHQVQGSIVTPAAVYLEQARQAADELFGRSETRDTQHRVADFRVSHAMFVSTEASRRVQVTIAPESNGQSSVAIVSQPVDDPHADWLEHATARIIHGQTPVNATADDGDSFSAVLQALESTEAKFTAGDDFYEQIASRGFAYGPAFQVVDSVDSADGKAVASLQPTPATTEPSAEVSDTSHNLHPVWIDACWQTFAGAIDCSAVAGSSTATFLPQAIGSVRILGDLPADGTGLRCVAEVTSDDSSTGEVVTGNAWLLDEDDQPIVKMLDMQVQRTGAAGSVATGPEDWLYQINWQEAPLDAAAKGVSADGVWLLLADRQGVADELADLLESGGGRCVVVERGETITMSADDATGRTHFTIDLHDASHYDRVLEALLANPGAKLRGVVHAWSLDTPALDVANPQQYADTENQALLAALLLVQRLARRTTSPADGVWLLTQNAQAVDAAASDVAVAVEQAPLVGFGRVAQNEHPELGLRLLDLQQSDSEATQASQLFAELLAGKPTSRAGADEGEVAYRDGARYSPRLEHHLVAHQVDDRLAMPTSGAYQLRIAQQGTIEGLRYELAERNTPPTGGVEVQIHAAGLNFSDVLKALGLYPGLSGKAITLGLEASGVVTAVGEGVDQFAIGDEVFGMLPDAFGSHATTNALFLAPKPAGMSHAEAATLPITFLTAHHALVRLAQLAKGERILIHAGAGGVGLAAIQIAQTIGAEVFATAGSDAKRDYLRSLGVEHVMNSRSLDFAEEILAATNREGIDVVLNSLPGEAIPRSLGLLRAYGRFLEIGKADIYQDHRLGLSPFQDNLSYFAIDFDRILRQRPEYIRELMAEIVERLATGEYRPLNLTRFPAAEAPAAFRYMSQRKNIGKVVVEFDGGSRKAEGGEDAHEEDTLVREDGAYLITGGLGALGLRVAERLAAEGAGALVLVSRRAPSEAAKAAIAEIEAHGARVECLQADVADADSLTAGLAALKARQLPPLRGVVHAAGVLDDGVIAQMSADQLQKVLQPKTVGGWNLHAATLGAPLDFFVMFSSVAAVLGSPGQANYAAANASLDALAHARRAAGLPATAINWGPWADGGMAADEDLAAELAARGTRPLPADGALDAMMHLLQPTAEQANASPTQLTVLDADWAAMRQVLADRSPPMLADLLPEADATAADSAVDHHLRKHLISCAATERQAELQTLVRNDLAKVMSVSPDGLNTAQPLAEFGIDSLMSLELKNGLERRLGITLPMARLLEGPSIESLATEVGSLLVASSESADTASTTKDWTPLMSLRSGEGDPLFLLPTLGGDILCYRELVASLSVETPIYAFRSRGLDDDGPPHTTMEELVADYAAAIRQQQPKGPYRLAGWSTGGMLAIALAEELERQGEQIALLSLFDPPPPNTFRDVDLDDEAGFLYETMQFASRFSNLTFGITANELRAMDHADRLPAAIAEAHRAGLFSAEVTEHHVGQMLAVGAGLIRACAGYEPDRLATPAAAFRPREADGFPHLAETVAQQGGGWLQDAGLADTVQHVDGDHFSMMTGAGAKQIASHLDELLSESVQV